MDDQGSSAQKAAGKSVWISGGASGIGRATAERLLASGWSVFLADFNQTVGEQTVEQLIRSYPDAAGRIGLARVDVLSEDDIETSMAQAAKQFGGLDCVINNAGIGGAFGPITEIDVAAWDYTFAVLTRGVMLGIKHAARLFMKQGRGGSIVNLGSIAGLCGGIGPQAYSAAKAAVINLTQTTAIELAPARIRVNAVLPGVIDTPLNRTGKRDLRQAMEGVQPWPDMGLPDNIASVIAFLAGDDAVFLTGEHIRVDGGLMAAGPRLGDSIGGDPASRGLVGINRGSTGQGHDVRKLPAPA